MSIFSDGSGESILIEYEEILLEVISEARFEEYDNPFPRKLAFFAKKHIYPKYLNALNEVEKVEQTRNQKIIENFFKNC